MNSISKFCLVSGMLLLLGQVHVSGQNNIGLKPQNVLLNSPNVSSLGQYGDIPVGYYTGVPDVEIPIYEINVDGLKIPISLSYHASGIKVQQEASWVGLGWALNAGGQVMKSIRGQEDHEVTVIGQQAPITGYFDAKALFNQYIDEGHPLPLVTRTGNPNVDHVTCTNFINTMLTSDTEPDLYSYNFGTHSGKMITGALEDQPTGYGSTKKKALLLSPKDYVDFEFSGNVWTARDAQGNTYYFRTFETTSVESSAPYTTIPSFFLNTSPTMAEHNSIRSSVLNNGSGHSFISAWLLDSIVTPMKNKVVFEYVKGFVEAPLSLTEYAHYLTSSVGNMGSGVPSPPLYPTRQYVVSSSVTSQALLKKISWPGGQIMFGTSSRSDLIPGPNDTAQRLSTIKVYNSSNVQVKDFALTQGYLGSATGAAPAYTSRLLLNKVTESYSGATYSLTYNMGALPPKHSLNTDLWGFYNGSKGVPVESSSIYKLYTVPSARIYVQGLGNQLITGANKEADSAAMLHGSLQRITYPTGGQAVFEMEPHRTSDIGIQPTPGNSLYYDFQYVAGFVSNSSTDNLEVAYSPFVLGDPCSRGKMTLNYSPAELTPPPDFDLYDPVFEVAIQQLVNGTYVNIPIQPNNWPYSMNTYAVEVQEAGGQETREFTASLPPGQYRWVVTRDAYFRENFWCSASLNIYMPIQGETDTATSTMVGGLRIKKLTTIADGQQEQTTYTYISADGVSPSGRLMSIPKFETTTTERYENQNGVTGDYRLERSYSKFSTSPFAEQAYTTQGSHVGYDKVQVRKGIGGGYVKYTFQNVPGGGQAVGNLNLPTINTPFNGLPTDVEYYNAAGGLVKRETHTYDHLAAEKRFYAFVKDEEYLAGSDFWDTDDLFIGAACYSLLSFFTKLKKTTETEYFPDNVTAVSNSFFAYNSQYLLPISTKIVSSKGDSLTWETKYPFDYTDPINQGMVSRSMVGIPIERISLINNLVRGASRASYQDTLGMYVLKRVAGLNAPAPATLQNYGSYYRDQVSYWDYNTKGRAGMESENGQNTVYLWGYGNQYPVVKVTNATYAVVRTVLGQSAINALNTLTVSDGAIRNAANTLRSDTRLKNAQVTTYTYKPLVGITSETDASGRTVYYDYDSSGRLLRRRDHFGNTQKEFKYNFRP